MKISIEGMDGVGKTTVANRLTEDFGFKNVSKPLNILMLKEGMNNDEIADFYSFLYGIKSNAIKSWIIGLGNISSIIQNEDEDVLLDRHFCSNYFWNGSEESEFVFQYMKDLIGVHDLTILLYASVETRMKRLYERNPEDYDLKDPEKRVLGYDKMIYFLDKFNLPYIVVNTENKSKDEVYSEVYDAVTKVKTREQDRVKELIK